MGRGTREKIMELAIDMFNEKGAATCEHRSAFS